jgi:hypothetical protein
MPQNVLRFQESITQELLITKDRVRDLIGPANWGEEGRYKEAILRKIISQFLPGNLSIGTGFIISNEDHQHGTLGSISKQLDILIYDTSIPVVFKEGDFVIVTEDAVRGVIEVKATMINYSATAKHALNNILSKLDGLREFLSFIPSPHRRKRFVGVFAFNYGENFESEQIVNSVRLSNGLVNHISLGPDNFIRYWPDTADLQPPTHHLGRCYSRYVLQGLSFSYFISNLLHIVSDDDPTKRYWFSFPIAGTKEQHRIDPVIALPELE